MKFNGHLQKIIYFIIFYVGINCLNKVIMRYFLKEGFSTSSSSDVGGGASQYYKWGVSGSNDVNRDVSCPVCKKVVVCPRPPHPPPPPPPPCAQPAPCSHSRPGQQNCNNCDITKHPDIDKYVLKSSIPPCPDMRKYALKSMLPPWSKSNNSSRSSRSQNQSGLYTYNIPSKYTSFNAYCNAEKN